MIDQAREHGLDVGVGSHGHQVGHRVDDGHGRLEVRNGLVHRHEMCLEPITRGPVGMKLQQAGGHPGLEIDADRPHVPKKLLGRLFKEEAEAPFAPTARRIEKVGGQTRLPGPRGTGNENRAAAIVALATEHLVESRNPGRHPFQRGLVLKGQRRNRQHADPLDVDEERILVRAVVGAAVLDHTQAPCGDLIVNAVVEQDHRIGDVFLQPLACQQALTTLTRDQGGDPLVLQPPEQPSQLRPQDAVILQAGK